MLGVVKWFSDERGYGFILCEGKEYFAHYRAIQTPGFKTLAQGQVVSFNAEQNDKGPVAANITITEGVECDLIDGNTQVAV